MKASRQLSLAAFWVLFALFLTIPNPAAAEMGYVRETINITMRSGPGTEYKIIDMVESGQKVEILREESGWSLVKLNSGKEGWVLTRFLTDEEPCAMQFRQLKETHQALKRQYDPIKEKADMLETQNTQLQETLDSLRTENTELSTEVNRLKLRTRNFDEMRDENERTTTELAEAKQRIQKLESASFRLFLEENIKWFLSGAGVLLAGFVLGFSVRPKKKKSSLL